MTWECKHCVTWQLHTLYCYYYYILHIIVFVFLFYSHFCNVVISMHSVRRRMLGFHFKLYNEFWMFSKRQVAFPTALSSYVFQNVNLFIFLLYCYSIHWDIEKSTNFLRRHHWCYRFCSKPLSKLASHEVAEHAD